MSVPSSRYRAIGYPTIAVESPEHRARWCEVVRPDRSRRRTITLIVVTLALLIGGTQVLSTRAFRSFGCSKTDIARATVKKYAYEAYPMWSADHPGQACPRHLEELNEYMTNKDTRDPWGNTYRMVCGLGMPTAVSSFRGSKPCHIVVRIRTGSAADVRGSDEDYGQ
jgi:hypothetical protein